MKKLTHQEAESLLNRAFSQYTTTHKFLFTNGYCFNGVTRPPRISPEFLTFFKEKLKEKGILKND